ncbi:YggT family protein [candidate division TA06 bacterium]|uniref:YggT family protein n=1 Tax=candidate division TA06 bacterium TaxID=2250710 RepID=A0A933I8Y9_UNCT6|nr:YggT family protein [candidate division TA06 bacterium]
MFLLANLIIALGKVLGLALDIYMWAIIIRALLSWVNPDPYNPIVRLLHKLTEPCLRPVRRIIPLGAVGLDLSPMLAILAIIFIKQFLITSLIEWGFRLKQI